MHTIVTLCGVPKNHVSDDSKQLSKIFEKLLIGNFFEIFSLFKWFWQTFKNILKFFKVFFRLRVTKVQFFFDFSMFQAILNFSDFLQNRSGRGGEGRGDKILVCDKTGAWKELEPLTQNLFYFSFQTRFSRST